MSERHLKNVEDLCDTLRITNPIKESDLKIEAITFYTDDSEIIIKGTPMNYVARLFFQSRYDTQRFEDSLRITTSFRLTAEQFFAERWHDAEEKGRQLLIAFKQAIRFKIHWKQP